MPVISGREHNASWVTLPEAFTTKLWCKSVTSSRNQIHAFCESECVCVSLCEGVTLNSCFTKVRNRSLLDRVSSCESVLIYLHIKRNPQVVKVGESTWTSRAAAMSIFKDVVSVYLLGRWTAVAERKLPHFTFQWRWRNQPQMFKTDFVKKHVEAQS